MILVSGRAAAASAHNHARLSLLRLASSSLRRPAISSSCQRPRFSSTFTVLGIETSCDDTGVAIVRSDGLVLGEALHSQTQELVAKFGGIHPSAAAQGHIQWVDRMVDEALEKAGCSLQDVDVIAATIGPGLAACLAAGLGKAKRIVEETRKPFIGINHLEAHALTPRLYDQSLKFPFLILLASGGNCQLVLAEKLGTYHRLGAALDDAPGEAYDKVARHLGIDHTGMSGGAAVEQAARLALHPIRLVVPMTATRDCNFSFSGLKTQVKRLVEESTMSSGKLEQDFVNNVAAGFQNAIIKHIATRTTRAILYVRQTLPELRAIVVSGGVASNQAFRDSLQDIAVAHRLELVCPPPRLCTDNGVMIAWAGVERYACGLDVMRDPDAVQTLRYHPHWPLGDDISQQVADAAIRIVN